MTKLSHDHTCTINIARENKHKSSRRRSLSTQPTALCTLRLFGEEVVNFNFVSVAQIITLHSPKNRSATRKSHQHQASGNMGIYHKRKIPAKADMSICIIILQLLRWGKEEAKKLMNEPAWMTVQSCSNRAAISESPSSYICVLFIN